MVVLSKQNYILKLLIALECPIFAVLSFGGNLDFPDFLQKSFITSTAAINFIPKSFLFDLTIMIQSKMT